MKTWVLDTNVVVSALLSPGGSSARVLDAVLEGRLRMAYDARILAEYRDVLRRPKFRLSPEKVMAFLKALRGQDVVTARRLSMAGPDRDDLIFVEVALVTNEKTIVTGNLAHFPDSILHGARVLSPAQAAKELDVDGDR